MCGSHLTEEKRMKFKLTRCGLCGSRRCPDPQPTPASFHYDSVGEMQEFYYTQQFQAVRLIEWTKDFFAVNAETLSILKFVVGVVVVFGVLTYQVPIAEAAPITGIRAYWKMDESSGNAADATGNGFTGVNTSVTYAAEKINNGGVFNGSAYFNTGATNPLFSASATSFSVAFWFNVTASTWTNPVTLALDDSTGNPNGNNGFYVALDNRNSAVSPIKGIQFAAKTTTGSYYGSKSNNNVLNATGLHYVVCTYDGVDTGHIYVDGFEVTATVYQVGTGTFIPRNSNLYIGAENDTAIKVTGAMDETGVWTRALTSLEDVQLFNNNAGLQYPFFIPSNLLIVQQSLFTHLKGTLLFQ